MGLKLIDLDQYDYLYKLDGDLEFGSTCFEKLIEKFEANPNLGTASGKCGDRVGSQRIPLRTSDDFS